MKHTLFCVDGWLQILSGMWLLYMNVIIEVHICDYIFKCTVELFNKTTPNESGLINISVK